MPVYRNIDFNIFLVIFGCILKTLHWHAVEQHFGMTTLTLVPKIGPQVLKLFILSRLSALSKHCESSH